MDNISKKPTVSVVLPAYNEELVIEKTLKTIKDQDYPEPFEIVVCDNNSVDRTSEIASKMGAKVILEKRKGTRFAYDSAIKNSSGDLILITNADVKLPKNWISSIVKKYEDPKVVGVGTKVKFYGCPNWINVVLGTLDTLNPKKGMWGVSMSCRRWVYEKVGGFNHGVNTNEDAVFQLLIEKFGKIEIVDKVTVEMDGRRFNKGFFNAIREWFKGYGFNALVVMFNYSLFHKIEAISVDFKDYRSEVYGKGEEFQLCTILTINNDAESIIHYVYSYKKQNFDKKSCLIALIDKSTDETAKIIKLFPWIKVSYRKHKIWAEDILDIVIGTKAAVYVFSTPDVRLPENWLNRIYSIFEKNGDVGLVGGPYIKAMENIVSKSIKTPFKIFRNINEFNFACKGDSLANALAPDVNSQKELLDSLREYGIKDKFSNSLSVISLKEDSNNIRNLFSNFVNSFKEKEKEAGETSQSK